MRTIILAAGEGARLRPLTEHRPKHLIPIAGKPIIQHLIEAFRHNGVRRFTIVVGYLKDAIQTYLYDGTSLDVKIDYVHQTKARGTADAVAQLQNRIKDPRFILCYGDIYASHDATAELVRAYNDMSIEAALAVVRVKNQGQYGQVTVENEYVKSIVEKPKRLSPDCFVNAGMYLFERNIFDKIRSTARSPRGELELTDSIAGIIRSGAKIKPLTLDRKDWLDIGRPWDLLEANERALQTLTSSRQGDIESNAVLFDPVIISPGAKILSGARIEGPTFIGEGSVIGPNCYVRPYTSIGKHARVGNGCEIKNCIIMDHTKIPHQSYFGDSIVGERCNFGAGTITGNLRLDEKNIQVKIKSDIVDSGRRKLGAIIGDRVSTGINVNFMPGVKIGSETMIGPGITVYSDLPSKVKVLLRQKTTTKRIKPHRT